MNKRRCTPSVKIKFLPIWQSAIAEMHNCRDTYYTMQQPNQYHYTVADMHGIHGVSPLPRYVMSMEFLPDFLDDFYWSFSDNLPPDFFEFPNEAIVPLNYSNPIESLVFQKCSIISTSFFEIDQSLIINMVDNLLDHQRKSLTQFIHG